MKLPAFPTHLDDPLPGGELIGRSDLTHWSRRLASRLRDWHMLLIAAINGGLILGDGTDTGNLKGVWATVADTGLADTEFTVTHNLGDIPVQFFYTLDKGGVVYKSNEGSWTNAVILLKCSAAHAAVRMFVCSPR
jgi:hypothetical protein